MLCWLLNLLLLMLPPSQGCYQLAARLAALWLAAATCAAAACVVVAAWR
jgi:hypothetical protein